MTSGANWSDNELDAIVADYFAMLNVELSGKPYVKSRHSAALMERIARSHKSVEFKHQNNSAVLDELGLPWISGYKPKRNYQQALLDAIDRYLSHNPEVVNQAIRTPSIPTNVAGVFTDPPVATPVLSKTPVALEHLMRKFDPVKRDHHNRKLGKAGEQFVFTLERKQLLAADRADLAAKVRWVAKEEGDGAGYDIHSFDLHGQDKLVEVKTTAGSVRTPFFLTHHEAQVAKERADKWCLYRVFSFRTDPHVYVIFPPLEKTLHLQPAIWRVSIR